MFVGFMETRESQNPLTASCPGLAMSTTSSCSICRWRIEASTALLLSTTRGSCGTPGIWMWRVFVYQKNVFLLIFFLDIQLECKAPTFAFSPQSHQYNAGEDIALTYQVTGYPEPRLDFFKDGKPIRNNEIYSIGN